jgi:hypothetical protein
MVGLIEIFAAFAAIVFIVRRKVNLGTAMVLGAVVLAVLSWAGQSLFDAGTAITPRGFLRIIGRAFWDTSSRDPSSILKLCGVVALVLILSHCLEKTGQMKQILRSFQGLVGNARVVLATLPALIGLLPMPGGAVFSAPMVEEAQKEIELPPTRKTLVNYWFRHLWEYSWPLYPGLLLASELSKMSVFKLAAIQSPLTAAALLGGIIFILRKVPRPVKDTSAKPRDVSFAALAVELSPIAAIIAIVVFLHAALDIDSKTSLLLALVAAIVLTLVISSVKKRMPPVATLRSLPVARTLNLVYVVIALMIFRGAIEGSGAVTEIAEMMKTYRVPLFPFIALLSFISGLVTGLAMAYVGIVFPIAAPLILQVTSNPLPFLVLAFGSGFIGVLFSPVHICLILTHQYFESDFSPVYRGMIGPVLVVFATLIGLFLLLLYVAPASA